VRFRFRANFDGYLYVMNQATSGNYETLFPRAEYRGAEPHRDGKVYVVPATQGVSDHRAPGYDVLYWMVTPLVLARSPVSAAATAPQERPGSAPLDAALRRHYFQSSRGVRG